MLSQRLLVHFRSLTEQIDTTSAGR